VQVLDDVVDTKFWLDLGELFWVLVKTGLRRFREDSLKDGELTWKIPVDYKTALI
jgi:hypothetical protein